MLNLSEYAKLNGLTADDLIGRSRKKHISDIRQVYWYMLRENDYTYPRIAEMFNRRHSNIVLCVKRIAGLIEAKDNVILKLYNTTKMSHKQQILIIKPEVMQTENFVFHDFVCPKCNGRGGFVNDSRVRNCFDEPDWEICKMCNGMKKLTANITVEWLPNK